MHRFSPIFRKCLSGGGGAKAKPKVCVVGAGPAGFYAAQHLVKKLDPVEVDIYERLPVPFGLVRFGVAPDHPEVKNVENTFAKTAENPNVRFLGNVCLGADVTLKQLRAAYHVVLLTYGAEQNRKLNVPGENLTNVLSARNIVGWYNGTPWDSDLKIDLSAESVAILGQGNVAIDVARILLTPIDELKKTDITQHALEALAQSKIRTVRLIGRRGPLQAAFTIKELREMLKLKNCTTVWNELDFSGVQEAVSQLPRPKKRITELMLKSLQEKKQPQVDGGKLFKPVFHRAPLELIGGEAVEKVKLGVTKLVGDDLINKTAELTGAVETIESQMVVTSIGYKSVQADGDIPFDGERGVVRNVKSKVEDGLYCSGWLSTGPSGVILNTMSNAFATAEDICDDLLRDGSLLEESRPGFEEIGRKLGEKNVQVVKWGDWLKIDRREQEEGKKYGKPREKIVDVRAMLKIASS